MLAVGSAGCTRAGFAPAAGEPRADTLVAADRGSPELGLPDLRADSTALPYCTGAALTGSPYAGGTGTPTDPFTICTGAQLHAIAGSADLGKSFKLMADLDLTTSSASFRPIGSATAPFTGNFDGDGRFIAGLSLLYPDDDHIGFFGTLGGSVTRLQILKMVVQGKAYVGGLAGRAVGATITGCSTSGELRATGYGAGGIAGYADKQTSISESSSSVAVTSLGTHLAGLVGANSGTIQRCFASGKVVGETIGGCAWAAGLVGENHGTISRSYATGQVITAGAVGAGLVGWNRQGTISDCYASGTVEVAKAGVAVSGCTVDGGGGYAGGLVAIHSQGSIERSYATGSVKALGSGAGGLVGVQYAGIGAIGNPTTIACFSTGIVSASDLPGGLIGVLNSGTQSNSYWDRARSGLEVMCGSGSALQSCDNSHGISGPAGYFGSSASPPLDSWDFSNVWQENPGSLPTLR